jgi:hypothetical protein
MSRLLIVAVLASYCVSLISGHAVMTNPVAWNPSPSKGNPCGGGAAQGTAAVTYQEGASITVGWRVVAGDGNGAVSLNFVPQSATAPTVPAAGAFANPIPTTASPQNPPVATGPYTLSATLPTTLTAGLYTMQARSTTDWFSCATVNITKIPTAGAGAGTNPTAQIQSQCAPRPAILGFCNNLAQGASIETALNPALSSMTNYDQTVLATYQANMASTRVFGNAANNAACAAAYKRFICAFEFPRCGLPMTTGAACKSACYEMSQACDLQDSHKDLYDCAALQTTDSDSVGTCAPCTGACALTLGAGSHVTYSLAVVVSLFAALFAARNL